MMRSDYFMIFKKCSKYDVCSTVFSMVGLVISVMNYEIDCYAGAEDYLTQGDEMEVYPDPMENPRNANKFTNPLRCLVVAMSVASILCNFLRYR